MTDILLVREELQGEEESVATGKGRSSDSRKKRPLTDMTKKAASIVTDQKSDSRKKRSLTSFDIDAFVDEYHESRSSFGFPNEEESDIADLIEYWCEREEIENVDRWVDIGRVSRELDLEELGKEKGSQNLPPATSTALDEVETQINDKLESLKNSANEQAENEALAYNSRIASLDFDGQFGRITQLGPEAIMEFKSEIKDQLNPLHIERNHLRELKLHQ